MFIYNNGVRIEILDDSTLRIGGKNYLDKEPERLKNITKKLSLFSLKQGEVNYDDLPQRLRGRINGALGSVYDRLDDSDGGVVAKNHFKAFGFLPADRERMKRAAADMNLIAYQMGLGSFEAAYEKFKERERKKESLSKEAAKFIDDFNRSKDVFENFEFFKSELSRLGMSKHAIAKEYNDLVYAKTKISEFTAMDKNVRVDAFIQHYKQRGYNSFAYFNAVMQSFGIDNTEIFKKYMDLGGSPSKNIEDFYNEVYKDNPLPDREKIEKFVIRYKESGENDFAFFHATLQDFGVNDNKEILRYFNDSIDEGFKLSSREFALISAAKAELINLQEKIIKDAVEAGLEVPAQLSRLVSPSDKIKDETINPQKVKMIEAFDFAKEGFGYRSPAFDSSGEMSKAAKADIDANIALGLKGMNKDIDRSVGFINLALIKNNGFSFDKMKEFALYSAHCDFIAPQKGMSVAITGLKQCNKLVECGILQSGDGKNFTFSSPLAREILFENPTASYNELADLVIKSHNIAFADTKEKPLNKELFDTQKAEFEEFLNAQLKSYYIPQGLGIDDFEADALMEESQEFQRYRDLYPELLRGMSFKEALNDYVEKDKYIYIREPKINFGSKDFKSELDKLWKTAQEANKAVTDIKSEQKALAQRDFINLSAVRFGGIDFNKLRDWGENAISKGSLSKETAEAFIAASLNQAEMLCGVGVMIKNEKTWNFTDDFAKESLFRGYDSSVSEIGALNKGERVPKPQALASDERKVKPTRDTLAIDSLSDELGTTRSANEFLNVGGGVEERRAKSELVDSDGAQEHGGKLSVGSLSSDAAVIVDKLNHFNYAWRNSGDERYRDMMIKIENELKSDLRMGYIGDNSLREVLDGGVESFVSNDNAAKSFFFSDFYDSIEEIQKADFQGAFEDLVKRESNLEHRAVVNG